MVDEFKPSNSFKELSFNEAEHRYFDEANPNIAYTSVTTIIGKYGKPYDKVFWGIYTALKDRLFKVRPFPETREIAVNGIVTHVDSLLRNKTYNIYFKKTLLEWEELTHASHVRGNKIHNYLEDGINDSKGTGGIDNKNIIPLKGLAKFQKNKVKQLIIENKNDIKLFDTANKYPEITARLERYIDTGAVIYAEKRVHIPEYGVAGTIDVPIFKKNRFCILDWKTNKDELFYEAGYYKKVLINGKWIKSDEFVFTDDKMLYPVAHLSDGKLMHYALQLSMYAFILEYWGYEFVNKGLEIFHIRPGMRPKLIKIPYLKEEVKSILEHHKLQNVA